MGSVYASQVCHYCGGVAESEDHVVPRAVLPKPQSRLPYWFREMNSVPACRKCNNIKGAFRSDCYCDFCRRAWGAAKGAGFILPEYLDREERVRRVLRSPA